jgi:hypothetical protein
MAVGVGALAALAGGCVSNGSKDAGDTSARPADPPRPGSLVQADALGNTVIGGPSRTSLAFRFRATWTGSVVAVRCYVIKNVNGRRGYSNGDGGVMRVSLQSDSGRAPHVPTGRPLGSMTFRPARRGVFPLLRFDRPAQIVAGRLYHVVFNNVGRDPERNYVSINALYSGARPRRGPAVPDGLAVMEGYRGGTAWKPRRSRPHEYYLPILDVVGAAPRQHDGLGYMEVWDAKSIGGRAMVRQLVREASGSTTQVSGVWLRVRRRSASVGPLVLRIVGPDGTGLASASVPARRVPSRAAGWVHVRFAKPATLMAAGTYALTASARRADAYEAFPLRKGTGFAFDHRTFFNGGYAQFNDGSAWVGWDQWGGHDRRNSDLQFALDTAR